MRWTILVALVLAGCAAPPATGGPVIAPSPGEALVTSGSSSSLAFEAAEAKAVAGDKAGASIDFERIYQGAIRSRLGDEALFLAAETAFDSGGYHRALLLYDKLLIQYPTTEHYSIALERQFQIGKLFVDEKAKKPTWFLGFEKTDASFGVETLEKFVKSRDRHPQAPEALFLVGEAHIRSDEPELAIESWQRLVKDYPQSSWARQAEYRIALAFLSLSYGIEYDKRPIMTGLRRLKAYVNKYPTSDNILEATAKRDAVEESLASHDLAIARRYARSDKYGAARIYLNSIRREYPRTPTATEAERLASEWPDPPLPPSKDGKP